MSSLDHWYKPPPKGHYVRLRSKARPRCLPLRGGGEMHRTRWTLQVGVVAALVLGSWMVGAGFCQAQEDAQRRQVKAAGDPTLLGTLLAQDEGGQRSQLQTSDLQD